MENFYLNKNWGARDGQPSEMAQPLPTTEFLDEMIREVKRRYPATFFFAEALGGSYSKLSALGFNGTYSVADMERNGPPGKGYVCRGLHEAIDKPEGERCSHKIRLAIERDAFCNWQVGGAGKLVFFGQHDRAAPSLSLGNWMWGAATLFFLRPGPFSLYNGAEDDFSAPCSEDGKAITFNEPATISYSGLSSEHVQFVTTMLLIRKGISELVGACAQYMPLTPVHNHETWVGYLIHGEEQGGPQVVVIVNPSNRPTTVSIRELPDFSVASMEGIHNGYLPACGRDSILVVDLPDYERMKF